MSFDSETLTYKALTYKNNSSPVEITNKTLQLEKQPNGKYGVASNQILIKVSYASLNPVDLVLRQCATSFISYFAGEQGIARDYSGTIVAIGEVAATKVNLKVGDKVNGLYTKPFGLGTAAEYVVLDSNKKEDLEITRIAETNSLIEAASWPLVLGTAISIFNDAKPFNSNPKVLIIGGATSVGRYVISLAKNVYNAKEVVTTNSARSEDVVKSLGSDSFIDYTKHKSLVNPVLESVKDTGKFDIIIDTAGTSDLFSHLDDILKSPKEHSSYISIVGDKKIDYKHGTLLTFLYPTLTSSFRVLLSAIGLHSHKYRVTHLAAGSQWIKQAKEYVEQDKVQIFIDSVHNFENFQDAIERLESNQAQGKILIKISDDELN